MEIEEEKKRNENKKKHIRQTQFHVLIQMAHLYIFWKDKSETSAIFDGAKYVEAFTA